MIKIVNPKIESDLLLFPESPQLLILENPKEFFKTVEEIKRQIDGEEGDFLFFEDEKPFLPNKYGEILLNPFDFDINDKKILNLLYKKLEANFSKGEMFEKFSQIIALTENFIEDISFTVPFDLDYEPVSFSDILKVTSVKIRKDFDGILEKIISYINLYVELKFIKFFVFVNLKSILNDEQLNYLYDYCSREKVCLLLVESFKIRPLIKSEKAVIITDDLCEIVENYP